MQLNLPVSAKITELSTGIVLKSDDIQHKLAQWQTLLQRYHAQRVVLSADTCLSWVLADLACLSAGILLTPLPTYLSDLQRQHALDALQPDLWLSDRKLDEADCRLLEAFEGLLLYQRKVSRKTDVAAETQKVTFTSGSTGNPKGVCLSARGQLDVAMALKARVETICDTTPRHLCLLPLPTLLENIAGIYAPLLAGGEVIIASDQLRGFDGSRLVNPAAMLQLINQAQPKSMILVPELLKLLIAAAAQGWQVPPSLQFIAVGGAYVSPQLLQQAAALKLPVYQGYGLSECASVVALSDTPPQRAGETVGCPLCCRDVEIIDGELVVNTPFLGYLGDSSSKTDRVYTGDLAEWTSLGELRILGRRKNLLINSFGRNISPEWVETALTDGGVIRQAIVFGDAQPFCTALLFAPVEITNPQLAEVVQQINKTLPDYARIIRYQRLAQPFSVEQGTLTDNGRLKRSDIARMYEHQIAALFAVPQNVTGESYDFLPISA